MTPRMRRDFEARWPDLALRVDNLLKRRGVPACQRDDVLQETALRLIQMWERVDPSRVPGLAVTVALNLVRDESRRRGTVHVTGEMPDILEPVDVEAAGLARIELDRLRMAMTELTDAQRSALLREIGNGNGNGHNGSSDSEKMLRMRARKKLRSAMERITAPLLLRLRKTADFLHVAAAGPQENLLQGLACIGCLAIGLSVTAPQGLSIATAHANPLTEGSSAIASDAKPVEDASDAAPASVADARADVPDGVENQLDPSGGKRGVREIDVAPSSASGSSDTADPAATTPELPIDEPDTGIDEPVVPEPDTGAPDPEIVDAAPARATLPKVPALPVEQPDPPALPE
jgi:hypothetical protein